MEDKIIAYILNNDLVNTYDPKEKDRVVPITSSSRLGRRVYRDTLCFLFTVAVNNVYGFDHTIKILSSIGSGYYYVFSDGYVPTKAETSKVFKEMQRLVKENVKIESIVKDYNQTIEILKKCKLPQAEALVKSLSLPYFVLNKACTTYRIQHTVLASNFGVVDNFDLRKYNEGFILVHDLDKGDDFDNQGNSLVYDEFKKHISSTTALSIDCIGTLNNLVVSGDITQYIEISENLQRRRFIEVADKIVKKKSIKVVFVAGPSSSNKTTFANKLCKELKLVNYEPIQISLDDYYFTKDKVPLDESGDPDLECIEAIDTDLFEKNLMDLYAGKEVKLPHFEFNYKRIGRRTFATNPIKLKENSILVIEGIHGLNKALCSHIDPKTIFRIYISPLIQLNIDEYTRIRTTDLRMLRRIVRDYRSRGAEAIESVAMWPSVERGEKRYIFPYQHEVDAVINSSHEYEIAVLAEYALPLLRTITPNDGAVNYITARNLIQIIHKVNPISSIDVPETSMLHEFIG